ncbi:hypothetical protein [Faecalibaculum rodentium]|uniref:hypothetical protein n=1 Tax=Faecalibaculum rodentium TaxID=1702221 RepID=UPI0023F4E3A5|nr:hypothetical protein [Faecalibaculum rodentium]
MIPDFANNEAIRREREHSIPGVEKEDVHESMFDRFLAVALPLLFTWSLLMAWFGG